MRQVITYFLSGALAITFTTCKKKTNVEVTVYNPYLNEYVKKATLAIIERKGYAPGGLFSGNDGCKEVAEAITDENGKAFFSEEKLKRRENYLYYVVIKNAWGQTYNYPCYGYGGDYLSKGGNNTVIRSDRNSDGIVKFQYFNLFTPAQAGDSIYATAVSLSFKDPESGHYVGGGGVNNGVIAEFDPAKAPYPTFLDAAYPTKYAGIFIVKVRKRKMGIVSEYTDTVKAYPNQTTIIKVEW